MSKLVRRVMAILVFICLMYMPSMVLAEEKTTEAADSAMKPSESTNVKENIPPKKTSVFKRQHISEKRLNEIEKAWEAGDETPELEEEFEHNRKLAAKLNTVDYNDLETIRKLAKSDPFKLNAGSGNKMMFAELKRKPDGSTLDKIAVDKLSAKWEGLIRTASLAGKFYNVDQEKILVSVDKTWMLRDIIKFLVIQPEVDVVTLDNKSYTKVNFEELLEEEEDF